MWNNIIADGTCAQQLQLNLTHIAYSLTENLIICCCYWTITGRNGGPAWLCCECCYEVTTSFKNLFKQATRHKAKWSRLSFISKRGCFAGQKHDDVCRVDLWLFLMRTLPHHFTACVEIFVIVFHEILTPERFLCWPLTDRKTRFSLHPGELPAWCFSTIKQSVMVCRHKPFYLSWLSGWL